MRLPSTPRQLDLCVTTRCNLRCDYCSHYQSPTDVAADLPAEEWLRFLEELGRASVLGVTLEGGEPFVRDDFEEIVRGIVRARMRFSVLSNGTLIDDARAGSLKDTGRCDGVQVSVDGSRAETHERFRGRGSFDRALAGIEALRRRRVPVTVRVTVHRGNLDDLEGIAALLLEEIGLPSFSTNAASHLGRCRQNEGRVALRLEDRTAVMARLAELERKYRGRIVGSAGPLAEAKNWAAMERARVEGRPLSDRGRLTSCGGVFSKLAVRADGVIIPCVHLGHLELGRIGRDDLVKVWKDHPELERLRRRRERPLSGLEFCRGCAWLDSCSGGCPAMAHARLGDDSAPDPDSCLRRFLEAGGRLPAGPDGADADPRPGLGRGGRR